MSGKKIAIDLMVGVFADIYNMYRLHDMDGDGKAGEKLQTIPQQADHK